MNELNLLAERVWKRVAQGEAYLPEPPKKKQQQKRENPPLLLFLLLLLIMQA